MFCLSIIIGKNKIIFFVKNCGRIKMPKLRLTMSSIFRPMHPSDKYVVSLRKSFSNFGSIIMPLSSKKSIVTFSSQHLRKGHKIKMSIRSCYAHINICLRDIHVRFSRKQHRSTRRTDSAVVRTHYMCMGKTYAHVDESIHIWCVDFFISPSVNGIESLVVGE